MPKEAVRRREIKKYMRYIQSGRCKISCIKTKLLTIQSLSRLSDLIKKTDAVVLSNIFRLGDHVAVILTQSSKTLAFVEINLTKYQLVDFGSICDDVEIRGEKVSLPCDSLAILLLHESDSL